MKTVDELAREAGIAIVLSDVRGPLVYESEPSHLSRFRDLVLEEAAKVCEDLKPKYHHHSSSRSNWAIGTLDCASAIRAMKGQK